MMRQGRGGRRAGAGRPEGSNKFGEKTKPVRIPISRVSDVRRFLERSTNRKETFVDEVMVASTTTQAVAVLYSTAVQAGFPSPADDYSEGALDLNAHLVSNPSSTFFVRVSGESMIEAGIHPGDLLVVDRGIEVNNGRIIIAVLNGELTVKRFFKENDKIILYPDNPSFPAIEIEEETEFMTWGVVTNVIHAV